MTVERPNIEKEVSRRSYFLGMQLRAAQGNLKELGLVEESAKLAEMIELLRKKGFLTDDERLEDSLVAEIFEAPQKRELKDRGVSLADELRRTSVYLYQRVSEKTKNLARLMREAYGGSADDGISLIELRSEEEMDTDWKNFLFGLPQTDKASIIRALNQLWRANDTLVGYGRKLTLGDLRRSISLDELLDVHQLGIQGIGFLALGFEKFDLPKEERI